MSEIKCKTRKKVYFSLRPWVNFTNLLVQSVNVLAVSLLHQQSFFCAIQFHQQNCAQLYLYTQLEVTPNFYAVRDALYASKLSVNPKADHKIMVKLTPCRRHCINESCKAHGARKYQIQSWNKKPKKSNDFFAKSLYYY